MAKRTFDHASVRIRNVDRSRKFYERLLQLTPAPRPDLGVPGMWYQLGEGQLHLIQSEQIQMSAGTIDPTGPHVAIEMEDLDAMRRQLKEAGIETLDFGGEQLWIHDPDGNTVELRAPVAKQK